MSKYCIVCQDTKEACECKEEIVDWITEHEKRIDNLERKFAACGISRDIVDTYLNKAWQEA
jgi:hypothetical protein